MEQFKDKNNTSMRHYKDARILDINDITSFFLNTIRLFLSGPIIIVMMILIIIHELKTKLKKASINGNGIPAWIRVDRILEKYGITDLTFYVAAIGYLFFFWFLFDIICNRRRKIDEYYEILYDYAG